MRQRSLSASPAPLRRAKPPSRLGLKLVWLKPVSRSGSKLAWLKWEKFRADFSPRLYYITDFSIWESKFLSASPDTFCIPPHELHVPHCPFLPTNFVPPYCPPLLLPSVHPSAFPTSCASSPTDCVPPRCPAHSPPDFLSPHSPLLLPQAASLRIARCFSCKPYLSIQPSAFSASCASSPTDCVPPHCPARSPRIFSPRIVLCSFRKLRLSALPAASPALYTALRLFHKLLPPFPARAAPFLPAAFRSEHTAPGKNSSCIFLPDRI